MSQKASTSTATILVIPSKKAALSATQKTYNKNIKEVDKRKIEVEDLEKEIINIQQRVRSEVFSEMDTLQELRLKRVEIMNDFLSEKTSEKVSTDLYDAFFAEIFLLFSESNMYPMKEKILKRVIEIHDNHAEKTYQELLKEQKERELEDIKEKLAHFGINDLDIEDFDMENRDKVLEVLKEKRNADKNEREQQKIDADQSFAIKRRVEQEKEKERSKTTKALYKQLVKELPPDLEADVDEQARKNELIQRITQAYNENDFFELLKLNIEHQTENKSDISSLADQEIHYYNQILKAQIKDLNADIRVIKKQFLYSYYGGKPQRTGKVIRICKDRINQEKDWYGQITETDFASLKSWKQSLKNKIVEADDDEVNYKRRMDFLYESQVNISF